MKNLKGYIAVKELRINCAKQNKNKKLKSKWELAVKARREITAQDFKILTTGSKRQRSWRQNTLAENKLDRPN